MAGRNGADNLSRFVSTVVLIMLIVSMFIKNAEISLLVWLLAVIGLIYSMFRVFSRNVYKRREENAKYLARTGKIRSYFRGIKERWSQRKEFVFFRCPSCKTMLRVPRGKGKIKVVCRKCGTSFIKKS